MANVSRNGHWLVLVIRPRNTMAQVAAPPTPRCKAKTFVSPALLALVEHACGLTSHSSLDFPRLCRQGA